MLTNVRQIFWKTEGVNTARLPFFVGGGGCFIGSGFSFHSTQQSNVNLVFSVSPQADMDSLEGNDTPEPSHKPFHQSHKRHTHHQLQEGAPRMAGRETGILPLPGHCPQCTCPPGTV